MILQLLNITYQDPIQGSFANILKVCRASRSYATKSTKLQWFWPCSVTLSVVNKQGTEGKVLSERGRGRPTKADGQCQELTILL